MTDLLENPVRTVGLTINAPAVFARPDFMAWLSDPEKAILSYQSKNDPEPSEYSDTVVLVDSNYEGDSSDMPEDIWNAICDAAYGVYGGPESPRSLGSHIVVRLTNLAL